jgi:hypothetical protein
LLLGDQRLQALHVGFMLGPPRLLLLLPAAMALFLLAPSLLDLGQQRL